MYVPPPPSAPSIAGFLGDAHGGKYSHSHSHSHSQLTLTRKGGCVGGGVLAKSYTIDDDDELDELDSPLTSLIKDTTPSSPSPSPSPSTNLNWTSKGNSGSHALRYQLLRDLWKNSD